MKADFTPLLAVIVAACAAVLYEPEARATPAVVGLWRFDEGSGTNVSDSSGLGNNGFLASDSGTLPTWTNGQSGFGGALFFTNDGVHRMFVAIPPSPSLKIGQTPTNGWTITAWAYESSGGTGDFIANYGRIMVIDDGTAQQLESGASGDDEFFSWARTTGAWQIPWGIGTSVSPLLDQWEHVAVVYDGTNLTFYLNGGEANGGVASQAVTAALSYVGYQGSIQIGDEPGQPADRNWNGMLDDVAVFAGALTQAQIQTVMAGDFSAFIGGPPGIVSQPQSLALAPGSTATFSVGAYGAPTLRYQWYFNGTSLGASGSTATLTLNNVGSSQAGTYWVVVSNLLGTVTSQPATLSVNPSLVGLWRFDEGSGTSVSDSSGLGNNGTLQGDNGNLPTWTAGQSGFGDALQFNNDGINHTYVSIPANPSLMIGQTATNPWTITAWAYESSDGTGDFVASYGRIMVIDDGFAFQMESGESGDGEFYTYNENADNPAWQNGWGIGSPVTPLLDQWEHWAAVYDGTNFSIYLNGNQVNGGLVSLPIGSVPLGFVGYQGAVLIGSELDQPASANWNGMLDDVAMFAGALTQTQIQTVMSGDFSGFMGGPPGIVSQPQGALVGPGSGTTLSVGADGATPLTYQWFVNGTSMGADGTNATLTLNNVSSSQAGTYWVVVSNSLGSVTSQPAVVSVGNLVALWRFNEGSGTTVHDSSGLGNNGTLMGTSGELPGWVSGMAGFGDALSFTNDGANYTYVSVPGSASLVIGQTATNPWTITAWAYENSDGTGDFVANYGRIMVIDDGTAFQLESGSTEFNDPEMYTWDRQSGLWEIGWGIGNSVSPLLDQWEHWAVVYDGTNISLYRDGNQGVSGGVASLPVTAYLDYGSPDQGAVLIGSELDQPADRNWNGLLDDVAVFNVALSQAQIQTVMTGDFSAFILQPQLSISSSPGNIILSWPAAQATFQLQSAANLAPASWAGVTNSPVPTGSTLTVTLPVGAGAQFFRLIGP